MGDNYTAGQAGAMGAQIQAQLGNTFQQVWQRNSAQINLPILVKELGKLRSAMRKDATEPEQDASIGAVAMAQTAAKAGDGPKVMEHLRSAGKWAFDKAIAIRVGVAAAALKTALGI